MNTNSIENFTDAILENENNTENCACCETETDVEEMFSTDDGQVCSDCLDGHYTICQWTEEYFSNDEIITSGEFPISSLTEEERERLGYTTHSRYSSRTITVSICNSIAESLFTECSACNQYYPGDYTVTTHDSDEVCRNCYEDEYFTCDECGEVFHSDNDHDGSNICESCYTPTDSHPEIEDYSYNVLNRLKFQGKPKDGLYLGVELEVNCDSSDLHDCAEETLDLLGRKFVVLKKDASIGEKNGYEIVSAPCGLEKHKERWQRFFSALPEIYPTSECGMHVHISRKPVSVLTTGKLIEFVNDERNRRFMVLVAGRNTTYYSTYKEYKKVTSARNTNHDRYEAINLKNENTLEFRMFASTVDEKIFQKNLEFVHAIVNYCMQCSMLKLDHSSFCSWLTNNKKSYRFLYEFLKDHGYF